jgi:hypothetical protein
LPVIRRQSPYTLSTCILYSASKAAESAACALRIQPYSSDVASAVTGNASQTVFAAVAVNSAPNREISLSFTTLMSVRAHRFNPLPSIDGKLLISD